MCDEKISEDIEKKYFEMNLKFAKNGLVESMRELAKLYFQGIGIEKNFDEAMKWFEKAVDEGDDSAAVTLGNIYSENKNFEKAIFYLSKAADKNNIEAIKKLAEIYESRNDFEKMFECYQKGANLGNRYLMEYLANCYFLGRGVQQDDLKALDRYIKIIEIYGWDYLTHNVMRMITKIYSKHFKFNNKKFLKYYVTTEKLGHFNTIFGIATELYKTDKFSALKWFRMADLAGDYDAALAVHYIINNDLSSVYIDDHYSETQKWYKRAVEFGNINAAKNLLMTNYLDRLKHRMGGYLPEAETSICQLKKVLEMEGEKKCLGSTKMKDIYYAE